MGITVKQILSGEHAFYKAADYEKNAVSEMNSLKPLKPIYKTDTENKVWRVVKEILKDIASVIFLPYGIYRLIHFAAAKLAFLPASTPSLVGVTPVFLKKIRVSSVDEKSSLWNSHDEKKWKVKRIAIEVDGYTIDAAIMGQASTLGNGRWVLASNGNGEFYEGKLVDHEFKHILTELNGNAIIFNYPGVGASSGMPSRSAMTKAYRAMLRFLEDQDKGIGAKEIIGYGHSIGGGVQGEALRSHKLKKDIKYVFVKSRTFSDLSTTAKHIIKSQFVGFLVKAFGWNMSSVKSSKNLKAPEIIMQSAKCYNACDLSKTPELIVDDGIISAEASLAKKLLKKGATYKNKYFMGILEKHNDGLYNGIYPLTTKIKELLNAAS